MNYKEFEEYCFEIKHNRDYYSRAKIIELLLYKVKQMTGYQEKVICPKCKGENQYMETETHYKCAYTDCYYEWIK